MIVSRFQPLSSGARNSFKLTCCSSPSESERPLASATLSESVDTSIARFASAIACRIFSCKIGSPKIRKWNPNVCSVSHDRWIHSPNRHLGWAIVASTGSVSSQPHDSVPTAMRRYFSSVSIHRDPNFSVVLPYSFLCATKWNENFIQFQLK